MIGFIKILVGAFKDAWREWKQQKEFVKITEGQDPKAVTIHPRYDKQIKYGFTVGGVHYYRFYKDYDIFENRFRYLKTFWQEVENKLTQNDIKEFCDAAIKYINDGKYIQAGQLLDEMKYRTEWLFEPTSLYKFASVIYFPLDEDVTDYNVEFNHDKIKLWSKKKELLRLFLRELMENAGDLLALSSEDFTTYLSQLQDRLEKQQKFISDSGLGKSKNETEVKI